jgi:hypothetical protein
MSRPGRPVRDDYSYNRLLGPHAATLERRVDELVPGMMGNDARWYREQREMVEKDPYGELHQIGVRAEQRQLDYAAERLALARAAVWAGAGAARPPNPSPNEMLAAYEQDLGRKRARRLNAVASHRYEESVQHLDAKVVRERSRELSDPYPSSEQLDKDLATWVKDNLEPAATLSALVEAERETRRRSSELERAGFEI